MQQCDIERQTFIEFELKQLIELREMLHQQINDNHDNDLVQQLQICKNQIQHYQSLRSSH